MLEYTAALGSSRPEERGEKPISGGKHQQPSQAMKKSGNNGMRSTTPRPTPAHLKP
jgi:hypothetical protein